MKTTKVEVVYWRQPEGKDECDSGQDAVIFGVGQVDSALLAVNGAI